MNKIMLLAKAHLKKNKGTSIGLLCLVLIATMLIGTSLLLFLDAVPTANNEAERLNAGDGITMVHGDLENIGEETIRKSFNDDVENYTCTENLLFGGIDLPYGDGGNVSTSLVISDQRVFDRDMAKIEIVEEDTSITSDYVYLPYAFHSTAGYEIGEDYTFEIMNEKLDLKIRGFLNLTYNSVFNVGKFEVIPDDDTYALLEERYGEQAKAFTVVYDLKDGTDPSQFALRIKNDVLAADPTARVENVDLSSTILARTFMALIIAVSNFVTTLVVLIVIILMISSSITNYVRENMKTIGALKAIGYTSKDIKGSLRIQFLVIAAIGSLIGITISYIVMPFVAELCVSQMAIPYSVSFNPAATVISLIAITVFTMIVSSLALRKIRKIEPIVALREGVENHNFKKNHFRLDKASGSLNLSLAMKAMAANRKQNIITFFVVGLSVFLCVLALLMFENFTRNPNLDVMVFDSTGATVAVDSETRDEFRKFAENNGGSNVRLKGGVYLVYEDKAELYAHLIEDADKLNNHCSVYKGEYPKYDNEIVISGKFAKEKGLEIGDEIEMNYGDNSFTYLITGFMQTANNLGKEAVLTLDAASHLLDTDKLPLEFYVDIESSDETDKFIDLCTEEYGDHILATGNYYRALEGSLSTFSNISALMLVVIGTISAIVILLVLYLLIKALIFNKRKDYGIYKAIGYTSRDLILQTAVSFMPSIILSAIVFAVVSYFIANPYMNIAMMSFGICQANFNIPIPGVAIIVVAIILLSFCFAIFESRKIKNIEAYNMLIAE